MDELTIDRLIYKPTDWQLGRETEGKPTRYLNRQRHVAVVESRAMPPDLSSARCAVAAYRPPPAEDTPSGDKSRCKITH